MRRFLALLAVFLVSISLASSASAKGLRLTTRDWAWHTSTDVANGATYTSGDSTFRLRGTGLKNSDEQIDTTKAIAWSDWNLPPAFGGPVTVAADTAGILIADIYPDGTTPTVTADTLDITLQVSDDNGATWTTAVQTGPKISPDVATMGAVAVLETGTSNCFHYVIRQQLGAAIAGWPFFVSGASAPTANQTYGWPLIRLLVRGDHTGKYRIRLTGYSTDEND